MRPDLRRLALILVVVGRGVTCAFAVGGPVHPRSGAALGSGSCSCMWWSSSPYARGAWLDVLRR